MVYVTNYLRLDSFSFILDFDTDNQLEMAFEGYLEYALCGSALS